MYFVFAVMNSPANPGQSTLRKTPCRYGMGCTHINDSTHNERFRHPEKQELSGTYDIQ